MARLVSNPPNPWQSTQVEYLEDLPEAKLEVYEEEAKEVVTKNDSPDLGFSWSCNPYRGCTHGCAYCYARPTHQYLGFGAGTDFERKIVVKVNAPERLRAALSRKGWQREWIMFSGVTDCYQPLEASYGLTRRCLEICLEHRQPVGIVTKGALVRRDAELLGRLSHATGASVNISVPFADEAMARAIEPYVGAPRLRFAAMRALADAGVRVGVNVAPVIPGLNDDQVAPVLEAAKAHGAASAMLTLLRLPAEVLPVFEERLKEALPLRFERVWHAIQGVRGGKLNESRFGARFTGKGPRWQLIERMFALHTKRLGLDGDRGQESERPREPRQGLLFGGS